MSKQVKKIVGTVAVIAGTVLGFTGVATGIGIALRAVGAALVASSIAKPKLPTASLGAELQLSGDPLESRKLIYGRAWTAGTLRFRGSTGTENENLYLVMAVAAHQCEALEAVEADRELLTLDGSGNVTSPAKWAGLINVRFVDGDPDQTVDTVLDAAFTEWTSNHRLRGIAYVIVRLTFDEENLAQPPQFRFLIQGRRVYDPRLDDTNGGSGAHRLADASTWEWSDNVVLCANDYMRGVTMNTRRVAGVGISAARFDWANVAAEANVCDETVALAGSPSLGNQARYTANGIVDTRAGHTDNLRNFEVAMAGDITFADGAWRFFAGAARTPSLHLLPAHFIGALRHLVHQGERSRFDTAEGSFASKAESGSVVDYHPISVGIPAAGEERYLNLDFQLVDDGTDTPGVYDGSARCQRIAKLLLERERAGKTIQCTTSLYGLRALPGETIQVTHATFGLSAQTMRVIDVQMRVISDDDVLMPVVDLTLEAGEASLYDWDAEETFLGAGTELLQGVVPPAVVSVVGGLALKLNSANDFTTANNGEASIVGVTDGLPDTSIDGSILWQGVSVDVPRQSPANSSYTVLTQLANIPGFIAFDTSGSTPFTVSGAGCDVAFVFRAGSRWFYDSHTGQVEFTPTSTMVALGWLETSSADVIAAGGLFGEPVTLTLAAFPAGRTEWGTIGGPSVAAERLYDQMAYANHDEWARYWSLFAGSVPDSDITRVSVSTAPGGTAMQIGNNSGNDYGWFYFDDFLIPYDGISLYEIGVVVAVPAGSGTFYCGVEGVAADGSTMINTSGADSHSSQHYHAAAGVSPGTSFATYRGFFRGWSGSPGTSHNNPQVPGTMYTGVAFIRPMIIANYLNQSGQTRIGALWVKKIEGGLAPAVPGDLIFRQSTAPSNPIAGWVWIDTDDLRVYRYSGSSWIQVAADDALLSTTNAPVEGGADNFRATEERKYKTADESVTSSTTLQDDDHMTGFALEAGEYYSLEALIKLYTLAAADWKYQFVFSNAPTEGWHYYAIRGDGGDESQQVRNHIDGLNLITFNFDPTALNVIFFTGAFRANTSTGGTVKLQWAQNSSNGTPTVVYKGSYMNIRKLNLTI